MTQPTEQDRAVTVEQAIDLFRNYDYSNWYVDAGRILADEIERLQARVAELEAEKWNAQLAESALLSVEKERDIYRDEADLCRRKLEMAEAESYANGRRIAIEERDRLLGRVDELETERDRLAAKCAELERKAQAIEDSEACAGAALMLVHDRFMRGVLTKEIMIDAVNSVGTRSIAKLKADAVREACDKVVSNYRMCHEDKSGNVYLNITALRDYAGQIEKGEGL